VINDRESEPIGGAIVLVEDAGVTDWTTDSANPRVPSGRLFT
jgi:hypothetical protein